MNNTIRILQADKTLLTVSVADFHLFDEVISATDAFNPQMRNASLFDPLLAFFEDPEEGQLGNTVRVDQADVLRMFDALMWLQTHWTTEFQQLCYLRAAGFDSPRVRVSGYDLSDDYINGQRQYLEWTSKIATAFGSALNKHFTPIFVTDDPEFEVIVEEDERVQTAKFTKKDDDGADEDENEVNFPDTVDSRYDLIRKVSITDLKLIAEDLKLRPKRENRGQLISKIVEINDNNNVFERILFSAEDHNIKLGKVLSQDDRDKMTYEALFALDLKSLKVIAKALNMDSSKTTKKAIIEHMVRYPRSEIVCTAISYGVMLSI